MLASDARPWIVDGVIVGYWRLVKVFDNGARRYFYKKIQGLCEDDFVYFTQDE